MIKCILFVARKVGFLRISDKKSEVKYSLKGI